jgi:RNA polymerase-binding transcription factor DksA
MPLSESARREIAEALKMRQSAVVERMTRILNGQDQTLEDMKLPQEEDPREPPLERLRRFNKLLNEVRARLRGDDYGLCRACGEPIDARELLDVPWAERCRLCAARASA